MKRIDNHYGVVIIGAGPAGLAAGIKLVKAGKKVLIVEKESHVGGISKTIEYKGYRFDLGGHRFFTKSKEVNDLWNETLGKDFITRPRLSRIYYQNKFFAYPVKPLNALKGLGLKESILILASYIKIKIFPYKKEDTFEEWVTNRFGKKLYNTFFKAYTEKLWGIPCNQIQAEWAAQRIKGLSMVSALKNAILPDKKGKIKTLIDKFNYPKLGPGMMYDKMAENFIKMGGTLITEVKINSLDVKGGKVVDASLKSKNGEVRVSADFFISSMPITFLVKVLDPAVDPKTLKAANKLTYRSFITVGLILNSKNPFPDTWIYVHSPEAKMGRIQNFENWSPFMVPNKKHTALGLEYFCTEGDELWNFDDKDLIELGLNELEFIKLGKKKDFVDGFVTRVPKTYPVYDSAYPKNLKIIKEYLENIENLQPVGRYGMFKYNKMDHSILAGIYAAENILGANHNIWEVNADQEYYEEGKSEKKKELFAV